MKHWRLIVVLVSVVAMIAIAAAVGALQRTPDALAGNLSEGQTTGSTTMMGEMPAGEPIVIKRQISEEGEKCISCHSKETPGIVLDWKESRHAHAGVSCIDCHEKPKDSPMAYQCEGLKGTDIYMSVLVPPTTCEKCHPNEVEQFNHSGHFRAYRQILPKKGLHDLMWVHEGQNHEQYKDASRQTGCMQCHGTEIKLGPDHRPLPDNYPTSGIGVVYPDGSTGNCTVCHTRHRFSIAEARDPYACATCHLGPDHPDIEVYLDSKHGQIYMSHKDEWRWDSAPEAWEAGDYRAPTCATCHMSGVGDLPTTHNVSERLYWNLWAKESKVRNSPDPMSPLTGNGEEGRKKMKQVCSSCHSTTLVDNYFKQVDNAVNLYNEAYFKPADKMLKELKEKGLLKENPWADEFQKIYYHLWHHTGRRARQGAAMGGPDWAHWHGFFELQQMLYELQNIYNERMETGVVK